MEFCEQFVNKPTIPIGLLGYLPHPTSKWFSLHDDVTFYNRSRRSCNELQMSCVLAHRRSCVPPDSSGAAKELQKELRFCPVFHQFDVISRRFCPILPQMSCKWAAFSAKTAINYSFLYLYLYFPSHYNIIFRKSQAILPKKFLKRSKLDKIKSIVCRAAPKLYK